MQLNNPIISIVSFLKEYEKSHIKSLTLNYYRWALLPLRISDPPVNNILLAQLKHSTDNKIDYALNKGQHVPPVF